MPRFSPEEIDQVRRHKRDTTAYVLVEPGNCFRLGPADFAKVKGRALVPVTRNTLPVHPLPASWVLVVLVCPGDDLGSVAGWASRLPRVDLHRVWFYELESADARGSYKMWSEAGLPFPRRERAKDGAEFNRILANELNIRILLDHPL